MKIVTSTFGDKVIRFSAIEDDDGMIACGKSHIAVMNMAIEHQWKNVLVLEDDVEFNELDTGIQRLETLVKNHYDVITLGGTFPLFDPETFKLSRGHSCASYLVKNHYFKILRDNFKEGVDNLTRNPQNRPEFSIDQWWCQLQHRDNWYIVFPPLMYQSPSYSDISKCDVDYLHVYGVNIRPKNTLSNLNNYLAFYSCYYGPDKNGSYVIPRVPSTKYNCYYYTNNKNLFNELQDTKWIAIFDNKLSSDDLIETTFLSKHIRTSPHEYPDLANYTYLCGFDSTQQVSETFVESSISEYFVKNNFAVALHKHPWRGDGGVWREFEESMLQDRYRRQKDSYLKYINNQIASGLTDIGIVLNGGWCIRNMKHPKINDFNDTWYNHILECGIQDQISLFFVNQLFKEYIAVYDRDPSV